jgi:hypothetical protein
MEKQKNSNPGMQQIIDILRPFRTEATIDYTSLKKVMEFVTRIEKRSRSKNIKHDTKLIRALIKPMMLSAEEKEKQDIIAMRHWHGPLYKRDMDDWL